MSPREEAREDYAVLVRALQYVKANPMPDEGICTGIQLGGLVSGGTARDLWFKVKRELFMSWPLFSGDPVYPVPGYPNPETAYEECRDFWEGEYGDMRRDLLDFLITECAARANDPTLTE